MAYVTKWPRALCLQENGMRVHIGYNVCPLESAGAWPREDTSPYTMLQYPYCVYHVRRHGESGGGDDDKIIMV